MNTEAARSLDALHALLYLMVTSQAAVAAVYVFYQKPILEALGYPPWDTFEPEMAFFGNILFFHAFILLLPAIAAFRKGNLKHRLIVTAVVLLGILLNATLFPSGAVLIHALHSLPVLSGVMSLILLWLPKTS